MDGRDSELQRLRAELADERARRAAAEKTNRTLARLIARANAERRVAELELQRADEVTKVLFAQTFSLPDDPGRMPRNPHSRGPIRRFRRSARRMVRT